jgi:mRNA-degrading endonuclease RelE of RelBE toxin-antitoxin system
MTPGRLASFVWPASMTWWRIRVGDYRVVYEIEDDRLVVVVVRLASRGKVYRDI